MIKKILTFSPVCSSLIMTGFLLFPKFSAQAAEAGFALGPALPLDPAHGPGVTGGLGAVLSFQNESRSNILRARGEVLGFFTQDGKAALPTLTGDIGFRLGALDLFLTGGVELLGVAWRADYALFSTLGFTGGLGFSYQVNPSLRLGLRGLGTWLPSFALAILDAPPSGQKPTVAFVSILLGVEFSMGTASNTYAEDF
jgi:hypothetical protein